MLNSAALGALQRTAEKGESGKLPVQSQDDELGEATNLIRGAFPYCCLLDEIIIANRGVVYGG